MKESNGVKVKNKTYYSKQEYLSAYKKSKTLCIVVITIEIIILIITLLMMDVISIILIPFFFVFSMILIYQYYTMMKPEDFNKKLDLVNGLEEVENINDSKSDECYGHEEEYKNAPELGYDKTDKDMCYGHEEDYIKAKPKIKDYCIKCGTPLKKWENVCPNCGKKR